MTDTTSNTAEATPVHPSVANLKAQFNNLIDFKEVTLYFKTTTDELGNKFKRPSFTVQMPVPSVEGIAEILTSGNVKQLQLLQTAVSDVVYTQLRNQVNELLAKGGNIDGSMIDVSSLSWEAIANLSEGEKKAAAITKETWDAFAKDYIEVITAVTGIAAEKVALHAKHFLGKLKSLRGRKQPLTFLASQLEIWFQNSKASEDFMEIYEVLSKKAAEYISEDDESLLENLGG